LNNWVPLQSQYDCFYFVADWHALTSEYADTSKVVENTYAMVADWIAAGPRPGEEPPSSSSRWCPSTPSCSCCSRW
jgi:tryptophanyl-tRNA synthetase